MNRSPWRGGGARPRRCSKNARSAPSTWTVLAGQAGEPGEAARLSEHQSGELRAEQRVQIRRTHRHGHRDGRFERFPGAPDGEEQFRETPPSVGQGRVVRAEGGHRRTRDRGPGRLRRVPRLYVRSIASDPARQALADQIRRPVEVAHCADRLFDMDRGVPGRLEGLLRGAKDVLPLERRLSIERYRRRRLPSIRDPRTDKATIPTDPRLRAPLGECRLFLRCQPAGGAQARAGAERFRVEWGRGPAKHRGTIDDVRPVPDRYDRAGHRRTPLLHPKSAVDMEGRPRQVARSAGDQVRDRFRDLGRSTDPGERDPGGPLGTLRGGVAGEDRCVDRARCDHVHPDVGGELAGEGTREPEPGGLRGRIVSAVPRSFVGEHAGNKYYRPGRGRFEQWEELAHELGRTEHVHPETCLKLLGPEVAEWETGVRARVQHERVEGLPARPNRARETEHAVATREIGPERDRRSSGGSNPVDELLGLLVVGVIMGQNLEPIPCELDRRRPTDSTGGTRHEGPHRRPRLRDINTAPRSPRRMADIGAPEWVRRENRGGTVVLTLDHPPVNVLSRAVLDRLLERIEELTNDPQARVVILASAAEKAFAAGADIREMAPMGPAEAQVHGARGQSVTRAIERLPLPVIAAVHGVCLGGGCEIALACDFILASEDARFGQPEINLGVMPGWGGTRRLPRRVGAAAARRWILTGEAVPASRALAEGLVDRVVPRTDLMRAALTLADELAAKPPVALAAAKYATRARDRPEYR